MSLTTKSFIVWRTLTGHDTELLKGVAIMVVMLHNYFHHVQPAPGENEFDFSPARVESFWAQLSAHPEEVLRLVFSFWGIYFLQVFLIVSAYGLAKSWRGRSWTSFVASRVAKLYPAFLMAVAIFLALQLFVNPAVLGHISLWKTLMLKVLLVANLFPGEAFAVVGPWWFYSLIFQFYLVFPLLMRLDVRTGGRSTLGFFVLGLVLARWGAEPWQAWTGTSLFAQVLGHLPEFCVGLFLARHDELPVPWWLAPLAVAGIAWGNVNASLWPFTFAWAAVLWVVLIPPLLALLRSSRGLGRLVAALGGLSMFVFATHGFLRGPFLALAQNANHTLVTLAIGLAFVAFSIVVADAARHLTGRASKLVAVLRTSSPQGSNEEENEIAKARTLGSRM